MQRLRSTNWQVQNRQGDVKNSMGNGEAKEHIRSIHGHELRRRIARGRGVLGIVGQKGKIWTTVTP